MGGWALIIGCIFFLFILYKIFDNIFKKFLNAYGEKMKKAYITIFFILVFLEYIFAAQARNIELVDLQTANTLIKAELRSDIKLYPGGGILMRLYIGIFDKLMIGGAFNIINLIGTGEVEYVFPPKFLGKIRLTDDEGVMPAISIGYEGQGYLDVPAKGTFVSLTKEINLNIVFFQLTGSVYANEFNDMAKNIDAGAGIAFAITRDFILSGEYDGFLGNNPGHINFGLGYFFNPIQIDIGFKYGLGDENIIVARILKIVYISYF